MSSPRYFGGLAGEWAAYYQDKPAYQERRNVFLSLLPSSVVERKGAILDLGCGAGDISLPLVSAGCRVVGVDASPEMLAVARKRAEEISQGRAYYLQADVCSVPLGSETFHTVFASSIIEYVESPLRCLAETYRVLCPGGVAIFSLPNRKSLYRLMERGAARLIRSTFKRQRMPSAFRNLAYLRYQHHGLTFAEWVAMVEGLGFALEAVSYFGSPFLIYWAGHRIASLLTTRSHWGTLFACRLRKL
jgi:ubiquinone/menaquinone biosynthesis C-methylase UbiE